MRRVVSAALVAILLLPVLAASPVDGASRYRLNLFRSGDFVSQVTNRTCVGASIQMMVNIGGPNDRSRSTQMAFWELARERSQSRFGGTNARGWAAALGELGEGHYLVNSRFTLTAAVTYAAQMMRKTRRPIGLLVWRGAHAWVLHGFEATADPAKDPKARITAVYVSDPWYPRISEGFGASPRPNSRLTLSQLSSDFLPWKRRRHNPEKDGRFFLVLPDLRPIQALAARHDLHG
jgi:hypothetical protein